jgi:multisubunit Na+/H+ antiporter MnhB subunit
MLDKIIWGFYAAVAIVLLAMGFDCYERGEIVPGVVMLVVGGGVGAFALDAILWRSE